MHRTHVGLALAVGLLIGGVAAAGVQVESDAAVDFDEYATYAWQDGTPARRRVVEEHIRRAVDHELTDAGLRRADSESADLWVVTHTLIDRHSLEDLRDKDYWDFFTGARSTDPLELGAGTLVVDLIDAGQERVVWRGAISEAIRDDVESNLKKIDKLIRKLFKSLRAR